ncbi:hypothetical protein [Aeromonas veronii]|uniref:hypothetical protein n=1 Tax=Aeromonas veronii TaxID=654 RepID=UPI003007DCC5
MKHQGYGVAKGKMEKIKKDWEHGESSSPKHAFGLIVVHQKNNTTHLAFNHKKHE